MSQSPPRSTGSPLPGCCLPWWQDTHISKEQHYACDNTGHHQHYSQHTEEACTRGEVHLAEREKEARQIIGILSIPED